MPYRSDEYGYQRRQFDPGGFDAGRRAGLGARDFQAGFDSATGASVNPKLNAAGRVDPNDWVQMSPAMRAKYGDQAPTNYDVEFARGMEQSDASFLPGNTRGHDPRRFDPAPVAHTSGPVTVAPSIGDGNSGDRNFQPFGASGGSADYETRLNPEQERRFQSWKSRLAPNDSGEDYDLRGAFLAGLQPDSAGHWPDTFKKPNHPTFSNESRYARFAPGKAGNWVNGVFIPPGAIMDAPSVDGRLGAPTVERSPVDNMPIYHDPTALPPTSSAGNTPELNPAPTTDQALRPSGPPVFAAAGPNIDSSSALPQGTISYQDATGVQRTFNVNDLGGEDPGKYIRRQRANNWQDSGTTPPPAQDANPSPAVVAKQDSGARPAPAGPAPITADDQRFEQDLKASRYQGPDGERLRFPRPLTDAENARLADITNRRQTISRESYVEGRRRVLNPTGEVARAAIARARENPRYGPSPAARQEQQRIDAEKQRRARVIEQYRASVGLPPFDPSVAASMGIGVQSAGNSVPPAQITDQPTRPVFLPRNRPRTFFPGPVPGMRTLNDPLGLMSPMY